MGAHSMRYATREKLLTAILAELFTCDDDTLTRLAFKLFGDERLETYEIVSEPNDYDELFRF